MEENLKILPNGLKYVDEPVEIIAFSIPERKWVRISNMVYNNDVDKTGNLEDLDQSFMWAEELNKQSGVYLYISVLDFRSKTIHFSSPKGLDALYDEEIFKRNNLRDYFKVRLKKQF